jgi:lipopolysaccharide export system permease protein
MASLLVLTNMSRQNEVLALYSGGISTLRLVSTFIVTVATVSTVGFLIFDSIVPTLNKKQILLSQGRDTSSEEVESFNRERFWYRSGRLAYDVGSFIPETNTLNDVDVYVLTPSFYLQERIHARIAHFENDDWVMRDGFTVFYPRDSKFPYSEIFETKTGIIPEKPNDFRSLKFHEDTMRLRELRRYITRNSAYGMDMTDQQCHYHERVALVFTPLIFVLLGIPFGLKPLKSHSTPKSIAFCFLIVFMYLLLFRMSLSIGKGGHLPPVVAAWGPNALFLALAGVRIMKG